MLDNLIPIPHVLLMIFEELSLRDLLRCELVWPCLNPYLAQFRVVEDRYTRILSFGDRRRFSLQRQLPWIRNLPFPSTWGCDHFSETFVSFSNAWRGSTEGIMQVFTKSGFMENLTIIPNLLSSAINAHPIFTTRFVILIGDTYVNVGTQVRDEADKLIRVFDKSLGKEISATEFGFDLSSIEGTFAILRHDWQGDCHLLVVHGRVRANRRSHLLVFGLGLWDEKLTLLISKRLDISVGYMNTQYEKGDDISRGPTLFVRNRYNIRMIDLDTGETAFAMTVPSGTDLLKCHTIRLGRYLGMISQRKVEKKITLLIFDLKTRILFREFPLITRKKNNWPSFSRRLGLFELIVPRQYILKFDPYKNHCQLEEFGKSPRMQFLKSGYC